MRPLLKILHLVFANNRLLSAVSVMANLLIAQFPAALAYTSKVVVDSLLPDHSGVHILGHLRGPLFFGYVYLSFLVFQYVGQIFLLFLNETLSEAAAKNIHVEIIKAGMRLEALPYFDDPNFHDHRSRLENNALYIPANFIRFTTDICSITVTVVGMIVLLIGLHPLIPFAIVLCCIPDVLAQKRMHRLIYEGVKETAEEERMRNYYRSVLLTAEYAKEVRIYDLKAFFIRKYRNVVERIAQVVVPMRRQQVKYSALGRIVLVVGTVVPYLWVIEKALHGGITPGRLVMFMTAIVVIQQQMARAAQTYAAHQEVVHVAKDLTAWIEMKPDLVTVAPQNQITRRPRSAPHVRVENLWFKYPGSPDYTLRGLDLEIERGKSLALVGCNGCGKTTLVKLLGRLYDPQHGAVYYDDVDIKVIHLPDLRRSMGVIFQDFMRYHLTVSENIALHERSHFREVYDAAATAGADSFIETLPDSYDTLLGKEFLEGQQLSGGQWQRLALARAFYRDAGMLILDEPTASVDVATEARIYADFRAMTQGKTVLLISHRLATVRIADRIAVIADGKVAELGDHESLIALHGIYHDMFLSQAERYRLSPATPSELIASR